MAIYTLSWLFSIFLVKKCYFLKVVKIPWPKNRFLVNLRSFFSTYKIFRGRGWFFPVSTFKDEYFNEKMSSLAGFKKSYSIFRKSTDFGHFWPPGSTFKVDLLNLQAKFRNVLSHFPGGEVVRNIVLNFGLSIFKKVRGGASRFASRHFPKSVILASCNFVRRPFLACYSCSIVIFHFS